MTTLLSKSTIYPIILPQKFYKDRYGHPNSLIEMNPSMNIDENQNMVILVRCVNYRKYYNKEFTMFEDESKSKYFMLKGKLREEIPLNMEEFEYQDVIVHKNLPTFFSYWKGIEDIRFVDSETILATVPEFNKNGNPSIYVAKIHENCIHSFVDCQPNEREKNWMPIHGTHTVIYSLSPFLLKEIEKDVFTKVDLSEEIQEIVKPYHGSTNSIPLTSQQQLFLIHSNEKEKTIHRWLLLDTRENTIQVSDEFMFFRHSYIEFPVSLCRDHNRMFVSLGVNDDKAFIVEITIQEVVHMLKGRNNTIESKI
jgi:hypothetical protein